MVGGNYIDIKVRREAAARYGLTVGDVQDVIQIAIGGMNVTETVEGLERYPVNLRYPRDLRNDLDKLRQVAVPTPMGHYVPLAAVADLRVTKGPPMIKSEDARRTAWIYVDLDTSDLGGYVRRAQAMVNRRVSIPQGVSIEWSGQYEYMQRADKRLEVVVPLTLAIIVLLLYLHFRNFVETSIVLLDPAVCRGGGRLAPVAARLQILAVGVGLIALAGLAAETGVVMLVYLDETYGRCKAQGRLKSLADLKPIVIEGAVDRVRPKLMTVAAILFGLLPIMWGTQTGSRVMKRIAAPMVGGIISSTVLTLVIIPAAYACGSASSTARICRPPRPRGAGGLTQGLQRRQGCQGPVQPFPQRLRRGQARDGASWPAVKVTGSRAARGLPSPPGQDRLRQGGRCSTISLVTWSDRCPL